MDSKRIPPAVANLDAFFKALDKSLPNKSENCQELLADWQRLREFTDAVFYPQEALTNAQKREQMELDKEAQEEVDYLLFELGIDVKDVK